MNGSRFENKDSCDTDRDGMHAGPIANRIKNTGLTSYARHTGQVWDVNADTLSRYCPGLASKE